MCGSNSERWKPQRRGSNLTIKAMKRMSSSKERCTSEEWDTLKRRTPILLKAAKTLSLLNTFLISIAKALLLSNRSMNPFISLAVIFKDANSQFNDQPYHWAFKKQEEYLSSQGLVLVLSVSSISTFINSPEVMISYGDDDRHVSPQFFDARHIFR